ncbi:MAG: hypothetical protein H0X37_06460 [Herpetosiphonaceae bacterium]|nr:hypothetical protein [Herpetosiphonaceae bacterium]
MRRVRNVLLGVCLLGGVYAAYFFGYQALVHNVTVASGATATAATSAAPSTASTSTTSTTPSAPSSRTITSTPQASITATPLVTPTPTLSTIPTDQPTITPTASATATLSPTPENTPTATPTATANIPTNEQLIGSGVHVNQVAGASGLRVLLLGPNGQPWQGHRIDVYEQRTDVSGNPTYGDRVDGRDIDQQGQAAFDLKNGTYGVCPRGIEGYDWTAQGCIYNVQIEANKQTVVKLQAGQIQVALAGADGQPGQNVYSAIYKQKPDVSGNPITGDRASEGRTDNTGLVSYWLTSGLYAVTMDLPGYNWGHLGSAKGEVNEVVRPGTTTRVFVKMAQLTIGLKDANGDPAKDAYCQVFTQKQDVNGKPTLDNRVADGRTDNGGIASFPLTQGQYALRIGNAVLYNVPLQWGKLTMSDGQTAAIK